MLIQVKENGIQSSLIRQMQRKNKAGKVSVKTSADMWVHGLQPSHEDGCFLLVKTFEPMLFKVK